MSADARGLPGGAAGDRPPSALDAQSPEASAIADLWWIMLALGTAVFLVVLGLLLYALFRRRGPGPALRVGERGFIVVGGVVVPALILTALMGLTLATGGELRGPPGTPERAGASTDDSVPGALEVEVVAHQFWWEFRYPEAGAVTANEMHVPVGRDVVVRTTTRDVIHSFWVPQLHGKIDQLPGQTTSLRLRAESPGTFRGICAEYCGLQHARMFFLVVAQPEEEFAAWLAGQTAPAADPATPAQERGRDVFMQQLCAGCHTVRGTPARGDVGPDLTHVATRRTLGAVTAANDTATLRRWVRDAQELKPGNRMPPQPLSPDELRDVVAYLEGLD